MQQYQTLLETINKKRTLYGETLKFDISDHAIPVLDGRVKRKWKDIVESLLWKIRGDTNAINLRKSGVKDSFWEICSTEKYYAQNGIKNRIVGETGPTVGFAWRHFGTPYETCNHIYEGFGIDQLRAVVYDLRENRASHSIVLSGRNPCELKNAIIHPRELEYVFSVDIDRHEMYCTILYRAVEAKKGIPEHVAESALFCHLLATICHLKAVSISLVFAQVYSVNVENAPEDGKLRDPLNNDNEDIRHIVKFQKKFGTIKQIESLTAENIVLSLEK